ncbi:PEP-CTERM sorting domain-containing protein [Methyloversatilis thermotolerans]|uniref:PEP-CTERM sorting domain-containing protein n=1 Tax=Methyloversatilis thermotolerans TaxID=1346290 RepID=UPI0003796D61|nr:PEP-CTERM sorting domain-containing protein [Methyloversatilis thermotolerans]
MKRNPIKFGVLGAVAAGLALSTQVARADSLLVNFTAALTPASFAGPDALNPFVPGNALHAFAQFQPDVLKLDGQFYISNWDGSDGVFTTNVSPGTRFFLHSPLIERLEADTWRIEGASDHGIVDGAGNAVAQRDKFLLPTFSTYGTARLTIVNGAPVALSYALDLTQPGVPGFGNAPNPQIAGIPFQSIVLDSDGASFGSAHRYTIGVDDGDVAYGLNTRLSLGAYPGSLLASTVMNTTRGMLRDELGNNSDEAGGSTPNISADGRLNGGAFPASDEPAGSVYLNTPFAGESGTLTVFDASGVTVAVAVVPEPDTHALMLAGLGLVVALSRRRVTRG